MATTELLQRAMVELEKLPADEQDAIAARLLAELEDEQGWSARFKATTDEQWNHLAAAVRQEIAAEGAAPLEDIFRQTTSKQ